MASNKFKKMRRDYVDVSKDKALILPFTYTKNASLRCLRKKQLLSFTNAKAQQILKEYFLIVDGKQCFSFKIAISLVAKKCGCNVKSIYKLLKNLQLPISFKGVRERLYMFDYINSVRKMLMEYNFKCEDNVKFTQFMQASISRLPKVMLFAMSEYGKGYSFSRMIYDNESYIRRKNDFCKIIKSAVENGRIIYAIGTVPFKLVVYYSIGNFHGFLPHKCVIPKVSWILEEHLEPFKWFINVLPFLNRNSIIIMNREHWNTVYRVTDVPTATSSKDDIKKWLEKYNLDYEDDEYKIELLDRIKMHKKTGLQYRVDVIAARYGIKVVRIPKYYYECNPVIQVLAEIRNKIYEDCPLETEFDAIKHITEFKIQKYDNLLQNEFLGLFREASKVTSNIPKTSKENYSEGTLIKCEDIECTSQEISGFYNDILKTEFIKYENYEDMETIEMDSDSVSQCESVPENSESTGIVNPVLENIKNDIEIIEHKLSDTTQSSVQVNDCDLTVVKSPPDNEEILGF